MLEITQPLTPSRNNPTLDTISEPPPPKKNAHAVFPLTRLTLYIALPQCFRLVSAISAIGRYELKMADSMRNNRPEWPIKIPDSGLNGL